MSLIDTLKYWNCISWLTLPDLQDKITNVVHSINTSVLKYPLSNNLHALYFNGASYITNINNGLKQTFTICVWVMQTSTPPSGSSAILYSSYGYDGNSYIVLYIDSNNCLTFSCKQDSKTVIIKRQDIPLINNVWYHISVCHTNDGISVYINGMLQAVSYSDVILNLETHTYTAIGTHAVTHNNCFTGCIKNCMIFNEQLNEDAIKKLYLLTYIQVSYHDITLIDEQLPDSTEVPESVTPESAIITLSPTIDMWIDQSDPHGVNNDYINDVNLFSNNNKNILIQFNIYNLDVPIALSLLKLHNKDLVNCSFIVKRFITSIKSNTSWNSRPVTLIEEVEYTISNNSEWIEIDVTKLVNESNSAIVGFYISSLEDAESDLVISSFDSVYPPQLTLSKTAVVHTLTTSTTLYKTFTNWIYPVIEDGVQWQGYALLVFDISTIKLPASAAILNIYRSLRNTDPAGGYITVKRFDQLVDSSTTWNTRPTLIETEAFQYHIPDDPGWFQINVLNLLNNSNSWLGIAFDTNDFYLITQLSIKSGTRLPSIDIIVNEVTTELPGEIPEESIEETETADEADMVLHVGPDQEYDGTTTDIIQMAINDAQPNSTVYLHTGTYNITSKIELKNDITIRGEGASNTIIYGASDVCNSEGNSGYFYGNGVSNVEIYGLSFKSSSSGSTENGIGYRHCFHLINCNNIDIHHCNGLKWCYCDFIRYSYCTNVQMHDCSIVTGHSAFYGYYSSNCRAYQNKIIVYTNSGLRGDNCTDTEFNNNTIWCEADSGQAGIELQHNSNGINIHHNIIYDFSKAHSDYCVVQNAGGMVGTISFNDNVYWNCSGGVECAIGENNKEDPSNRNVIDWVMNGVGCSTLVN